MILTYAYCMLFKCFYMHLCIYVCIKQCVHPFTQHNPDNFLEDWIMNLGVQIGYEALTPTKTWLCEIPPHTPSSGSRHQKHVFEHNSVLNNLTMKKWNMGRLDLNTENPIFGDFGIFSFKGWWGEKRWNLKHSDFLT